MYIYIYMNYGIHPIPNLSVKICLSRCPFRGNPVVPLLKFPSVIFVWFCGTVKPVLVQGTQKPTLLWSKFEKLILPVAELRWTDMNKDDVVSLGKTNILDHSFMSDAESILPVVDDVKSVGNRLPQPTGSPLRRDVFMVGLPLSESVFNLVNIEPCSILQASELSELNTTVQRPP